MPSLESESESESESTAYNWPAMKMEVSRSALAEVGSKGFAVLLTTGGLNPPHRGHAQMLHQAAKRLQREGYSTIGAFLSPTHDNYLQGKAKSLGTVGFSGKFRLHIARLTVENDSLVEASNWEIAQPKFVNFPEVAKKLKDYLASDSGTTVFYVSGTDHTSRCGLAMGFPYKIGLVVVPRTGERAPVEVPAEKVYVSDAAEGEVASFSSTKVREALQRGDHDYISNALSPSAARFLLQPTPEELGKFEKDFCKIGFPKAENPQTGGYAQEAPTTGGYA